MLGVRWTIGVRRVTSLAGGLLGRRCGLRGFGLDGGAGAHFVAGGVEVGGQRIEHHHGELGAPGLEFGFGPAAIEADCAGDVFGKSLPVSAFADEDVAHHASGVYLVNAAAGLASGVGQPDIDFAGFAKFGAVIPGLRSVNFRMMAAWAMSNT